MIYSLLFSKIFMITILVLLTAIYLGLLMFGNNSVQTLMKIENKNNIYSKEVLRLQKENSKLQKDYFELKNLEPIK